MNNLEQQIRQRLSNLNLSEPVLEDVIEEISSHLDTAAKELEGSGYECYQAEAQVLAQVGDWNKLLKGIRRSKEISMRDRFRRLWLPALATGIVAYTALFLIARFVSWPRHVVVEGNYLSYTWQWYPTLILIGAMGAYWSRQAGGGRLERVLSAVAPSIVMALVMFVVLPVEFGRSLIVEHELPWVFYHPLVFVTGITAWVIVPGVPCLLGALPFLREKTSSGVDATAA